MSSFSPGEFDYRVAKNGLVFISWRGRHVVTLSGWEADRFVGRIDRLTGEAAQELMARMTGNFKHGNERPRDRS